MRDRLIELLAEMSCKCNDTECENCEYNKENNCQEKMQADYLLANGVVCPPTADVVEVKYGQWKKHRDDGDCEYIECSVCREEFYPPNNEFEFDNYPKYCQECGAKMDGKEVDQMKTTLSIIRLIVAMVLFYYIAYLIVYGELPLFWQQVVLK